MADTSTVRHPHRRVTTTITTAIITHVQARLSEEWPQA
jgi:hypothetical protein